MKEGLIILPLLSIFLVFFLFLQYNEIETFFGIYTNGAMFFVVGMLGHNYDHGKGDICKKCEKVHVLPDRSGVSNGMYGKHHTEESKRKIHEAKKGIAVNTGKHYNITPQDRENRANRLRKIVKLPKVRAKISKALTGRPSPKKGTKLTIAHRWNIVKGMRESEVFRPAIRQYHREKLMAKIREFYNLPKDCEFIPACFYEHWFARNVLINGRSSWGLITQSGLYARPEFIKNNAKESEIPVTV